MTCHAPRKSGSGKAQTKKTDHIRSKRLRVLFVLACSAAVALAKEGPP